MFALVVNMPKKHKLREPAASPDEVWIAPRTSSRSELRTSDKVWIAPRHAGRSGVRTSEPADRDRYNRYLEFADIALGVKDTRPRKKKPGTAESQPGRNQKPKGKVTSIDSRSPSKQGFGAFRNSR